MTNEFNKTIETAFALWVPDYEMRVQVFSFAFFKGRILAIGRNKNKTHPLNLRNPLFFHKTGELHSGKSLCSEADLMIQIKNKTNIPYNKITICNIRIDRNKQIKNSRPCSSCFSLLQVLTPKNLYYTNDYGQFEKYDAI